MAFAQKVIIAVGLDDLGEGQLLVLKKMNFLQSSELHFVSVFKTIDYTYGLGEFSLVFPVSDDRRSIEETIISKLKKISEKVIPEGFKGSIYYHCLFDENPKEKLCHYIKELKADTVIVAARKKRGLFESSFTNYVAKHSEADVIILKQQ
jgi:nucleotide-binding universal stress UspA family protein